MTHQPAPTLMLHLNGARYAVSLLTTTHQRLADSTRGNASVRGSHL